MSEMRLMEHQERALRETAGRDHAAYYLDMG